MVKQKQIEILDIIVDLDSRKYICPRCGKPLYEGGIGIEPQWVVCVECNFSINNRRFLKYVRGGRYAN